MRRDAAMLDSFACVLTPAASKSRKQIQLFSFLDSEEFRLSKVE